VACSAQFDWFTLKKADRPPISADERGFAGGKCFCFQSVFIGIDLRPFVLGGFSAFCRVRKATLPETKGSVRCDS
jgi:hypothetical protein